VFDICSLADDGRAPLDVVLQTEERIDVPRVGGI
jgi:hypothetical protein